MDLFQIGDTIICTIAITDEDGNAVDPATSTTIRVRRTTPRPTIAVDYVSMTNDAEGTFHYDFDSSSMLAGTYKVSFKAIDGTRTSIQTTNFELEW